jgi:hypothetical protein
MDASDKHDLSLAWEWIRVNEPRIINNCCMYVQVRTPTAQLPALWRTPPPVPGAAGRARPGRVQVSLFIVFFYILIVDNHTVRKKDLILRPKERMLQM